MKKYLIGYLVLGNSPHFQETDELHNFQFHRLEYLHIHCRYHNLPGLFCIYFGLYSNSKNFRCLCKFHDHCNQLQLHMQLSRMKKNSKIMNVVEWCFQSFLHHSYQNLAWSCQKLVKLKKVTCIIINRKKSVLKTKSPFYTCWESIFVFRIKVNYLSFLLKHEKKKWYFVTKIVRTYCEKKLF